MTGSTLNARISDDEICPICGGLGLVTRPVPISDPDFGKAFPCVCQAGNVRAREIARLRTVGNLDAYTVKTFNAFEIDHQLVEAEEQYLLSIFPDMAPARRLSLTDENRRMIKIAAELALQYAEKMEGWLLLEGNYGSGKTHLAAAIANYRVERSDPVLFVTTPDLLDHLRGTFGPNSEIAYDELFERVRKAPLLVLDDLGAENQSAWAIEKLYQLLNDRHRLTLPTVVTTNRDPALIEPRIRSRLLDQALTRVVTLAVPDRRSPVMTWGEADLTNLDRYRDMTFDNVDPRTSEGLPDADLRRLSEAIQAARNYVVNPGGWLVFTGPPGAGKTHLAAAIAHECNHQGRRTLFVTAADLLSHLRATFYPGSTVQHDKRLEEIKSADILVMDDLNIEEKGMSSWAREKLYEILLHRFDYALPTVITTLQPLSDMDARLRSRVTNESRSLVVAITAPPYPGRMPKRRAALPRRER
jgi:DNA replication protein DnaC